MSASLAVASAAALPKAWRWVQNITNLLMCSLSVASEFIRSINPFNRSSRDVRLLSSCFSWQTVGFKSGWSTLKSDSLRRSPHQAPKQTRHNHHDSLISDVKAIEGRNHCMIV
jgi:hypothetical protein